MNIENIIQDYIKWIKDNTIVKTIDEGKTCIISTPFLDRHNDHVDIYLEKKESGTFRFTDDGYTINDLNTSGLDISTAKRQSILRTTLNGFGVKVNDENEIYVEASLSNIGQKKHNILQAILAVNDMFNLSEPSVASLFKEDVEIYFRKNNIVFTKDIKLSGKSGFDHGIDFIIPQSNSKKERLIKAVNKPKKDSILSVIMAYEDINRNREIETINYIVYNDLEKVTGADFIGALDNYGVKHIPWSEKEKCLEEFSL